jgi:DNA polymerase-1
MKLLLIDGYSLLYRAFFSSPPLTTKDNQPTGALYGFIRMVLRLLDEVQPECALVALDAHGPTFRHDSFESYKANRSAAPDDLSAQTRRVRDLLDGLSIPQYDHEGFEADDILGTLSRLGAERGDEVIIVTGDGDALQLVNEKVSVMLTRRGVSDLEKYTPQAVHARYNFGPEFIPDYKGLRGDASDNIPGVPGIGEKTAIKLISEFGGMEAIYENIENVKPPRIQNLLKDNRDIAFQSRDLARIVTDLPLDIEIGACDLPILHLDDEKRERALDTVREYEFKSLIPRFTQKDGGGAGSTPGDEAEDAEPAPKLEYEITRAANFSDVQKWLGSTPGASADGAAFLIYENHAALACGEKVLLFDGEIAELKEWIEDEAAPKFVHDSKTLKLELLKRDLHLRGVRADTMLMSYLIEPTRQNHPLDSIAKKHLSCELPDLAPPPEKKKTKKEKEKEQSLFDDEAGSTPEAIAEAKAAEEAEAERLENALTQNVGAIAALEPILRSELQEIGEEEIFERLELPLVDILVSMERCGMLLDRERLVEIGHKLEREAERLQAEIWELAGEEFNIGSPKQLQVILFEKLEMKSGRTTKTGYSTDAHTLEKLAEEHEIVQKILDYRGITKLKSTYVEAFLTGMDAKTHRIHTNLNQTGAVSGRLSSSDPNLQNIPIRTEQGRDIRRAFIAPPDWKILKADYSQIELRILAHITKDEPLIEAFQSGTDVHSRTAADLFDVEITQVDAEMRRKAKMTNYAIAYGVSGFGLAKQLGTGSPGEAQEIINKYFEALPGVKKYIDETLEEARRVGYVQTLLGRRRPLPEIHSPRAQERAAAERTAINHPIQGTAADIMKFAMLAVFAEMQKQKLKSRMLLQVHDELVFEVAPGEAGVLAPIVCDLMTTVPQRELQLDVPLEVDVSVGENWNDAEEMQQR